MHDDSAPSSQECPPSYKPQAITILATYRCTAECTHCCFESNPRIKHRLHLDQLLSFIDQAAALRTVRLVGFSGGECFLLGEDLNSAVRHAHSLGLRTRCVTNGYWAKSLNSGRNRLASLREAGLDELNISTGDFHQAYVDQETVINAASLSVELGLDQTLVIVEMQQSRRVTAASFASNDRVRMLLKKNRETFALIESPWMPMDHESIILQSNQTFLNQNTLPTKRGCRSILTTLVLTPNNRVGFCCGLPREQIPELNSPISSALDDVLTYHSTDFMKIWLFVDGPEKILAWAATKNPDIVWENRYAHQCHSCLAVFNDEKVRETIRLHYKERVPDVLMRYDLLIRKQANSEIAMPA